jgi:hypothetical protein
MAGPNLQEPGRVFGVALPATRPYSLAANVTKAGREFRFTRLGGTVGDTDLAGTLTATLASTADERVQVEATLTSKTLDIKDVGPLIGYDPEKLETGETIITRVGGSPRLMPDAPLAVDALGSVRYALDGSVAASVTPWLPHAADESAARAEVDAYLSAHGWVLIGGDRDR